MSSPLPLPSRSSSVALTAPTPTNRVAVTRSFSYIGTSSIRPSFTPYNWFRLQCDPTSCRFASLAPSRRFTLSSFRRLIVSSSRRVSPSPFRPSSASSSHRSGRIPTNLVSLASASAESPSLHPLIAAFVYLPCFQFDPSSTPLRIFGQRSESSMREGGAILTIRPLQFRQFRERLREFRESVAARVPLLTIVSPIGYLLHPSISGQIHQPSSLPHPNRQPSANSLSLARTYCTTTVSPPYKNLGGSFILIVSTLTSASFPSSLMVVPFLQQSLRADSFGRKG